MPELISANSPDLAAHSSFDFSIVDGDLSSVHRACESFRDAYTALKDEVGKVLVGQDQIVQESLIALFAYGHVLLEGVPGLGKTLLIQTLSRTLSLPFARIQFTPDLMPSDITGTSIVMDDPHTGHRIFSFRPGPIFHQLILADEINRATPKSQSALLEAMQERSVTVAGKTHQLESPFQVMATQNPIEQEGTYPLPEAQLDRFFFKILVPYVTRQEMNTIIERTTRTDISQVQPILTGNDILQAQQLVREVIVAPHVQDYVVRFILATHPQSTQADKFCRQYISLGVSPRGAQAMICAAKVLALIEGRYAVSFNDLHQVAPPALRHRIISTFEAHADGMTTDVIIQHLLDSVPHETDQPLTQSQISTLHSHA